jgi:predicted ArsR family transcriptional regulator
MDPLATLTTLGDATRRRVYEHVADQDGPVSRDEAAAATGIARTLAAYPLDRLDAEGLRHVAYPRRSGRTVTGDGPPS